MAVESQLEVIHQRREARTALELAVVALAPWQILERLATAAGLLEALSELPSSSPPARALTPKVLAQAQSALAAWQKWKTMQLEKKLPRG